MSLSVQYSKLCDSSLEAYLAYLLAAVIANGSSTFESLHVDGRGGVDQIGGGNGDSRVSVVGLFDRLLETARDGPLEVDVVASRRCVGDRVGGVVGGGAQYDASADVGLAGCDDGYRECGVAGDNGDEYVGNGRTESKSSGATTSSGRGLSDEPVVKVGRKKKSAAARRLQRKRARATAGGSVESGIPKSVEEHPHGFWGSCNADIRKKLVDSKAAMHIAENARRTAEALASVDYLTSSQCKVDKVSNLLSQVKRLGGGPKDERILGWARTVTAATAESVARSVSTTSSSPSYDGYLRSLLEEERRCAAEKIEAQRVELSEWKKATEIEVGKLQERVKVLQAADVRKRVAVPVVVPKKSQDLPPGWSDALPGETPNQHIARMKAENGGVFPSTMGIRENLID